MGAGWLVAVGTLAVGTAVGPLAAPAYGMPAGPPAATVSTYEGGAAAADLYHQGRAAGLAGARGAVILDFGRPAYRPDTYGTLDYGGGFVPLSNVVSAVEDYIGAYYTYAPPRTELEVVVGTNNSCGTGQPCGSTRACGCRLEPTSFRQWGRHFAVAVEAISTSAARLRARYGYSDDVRVAAGDDAEPGFDPGYSNTYELLAGYAQVVRGSRPPMVDYGDAAPRPWSEEQLYAVAYGLAPDIPFPEIYYPGQAEEWATLAGYAARVHGVTMRVYGALTQDPVGYTPQDAYVRLLTALRPVTGQAGIDWLSTIGPR